QVFLRAILHLDEFAPPPVSNGALMLSPLMLNMSAALSQLLTSVSLELGSAQIALQAARSANEAQPPFPLSAAARSWRRSCVLPPPEAQMPSMAECRLLTLVLVKVMPQTVMLPPAPLMMSCVTSG